MKSGIVALFALASFLAAVLLFSAQPMIGKMVLPVFGGTPAVWNTCLVFFQGTLLGGYLLSHGLGRTGFSAMRRVSALYLLGFAALVAVGYAIQPIAVDPGDVRRFSWGGRPALVLLGMLLGSAALPMVMVSMTAPLVQSWFARTGHRRANDPYFLYAASNAGSLLALLAYPFVIEPNLGVVAQTRIWKFGFLTLGILVLACGVTARALSRSRPDESPADDARSRSSDDGETPRLSAATWLQWIILVFITSSWLMGVTTYLTTDLAAIPLLWIIPLALYLLSFIIAFADSTTSVVRIATWSLPYLIAALVLVMSAGFVHPFWIPLHLIAFFAGSLACHGALARSRPAAGRLSTFYVTIALGGFLGGVWSALIAPSLIDLVIEYPLAMILACLFAPRATTGVFGPNRREALKDLLFAAVVFSLTATLATNKVGLADSALGVLGVMVAAGLGILSCVRAQRRPLRFALVVASVLAASAFAPGPSGRLLHIERDFFGVVRVTHDQVRNVHRLFHGSTLHGQQSLDPTLRREPSTYFARSGPIGQLFDAIEPRLSQPGARVAIVGLGAGTLASYARAGQKWTFYEIDDAIERIARDPHYFTYLQDSQADSLDIILGDARQRLQGAPDRAYQLIVLDAFSSDAVPVHLLSREAIRLYRTKLAPGGVLAFNLSNRYLDLDPVFGRQADDAGLVCRVRYDLRVSAEEKPRGKQGSIWAVMAAHDQDLGSLTSDERWQPPAPHSHSQVWTDDYSDLARYLLLRPSRLWNREKRRTSAVTLTSPGERGASAP
jgi:hypothetical protein